MLHEFVRIPKGAFFRYKCLWFLNFKINLLLTIQIQFFFLNFHLSALSQKNCETFGIIFTASLKVPYESSEQLSVIHYELFIWKGSSILIIDTSTKSSSSFIQIMFCSLSVNDHCVQVKVIYFLL